MTLDWRDVFFLGSKWDEQEAVNQTTRDFSHLRETISTACAEFASSGGGPAMPCGSVYIFGSVEPQWLEGRVVPIPSLVALLLPHFPESAPVPSPPEFLAITSVGNR